MKRSFVQAMLLMALLAEGVQAQEWARKMFEETSHDFGVIARGAKAVYRFKVKNIYEETVHIAEVRSSCGCTDPKVLNPTIETFETAEIEAAFNTAAFKGRHSATLTIRIDQPYPAEVQLQVYGNVRSDVVFQPGSVKFDSVDQGTSRSTTVAVHYAGRNDWQIVDVRSERAYFKVDLDETQRGGGRVAYNLKVELQKHTPPGFINDQLVLVTNDHNVTRIPLFVEGQVVPEITVSPRSLVLGDVSPGQKITKKLVVRGKQPFKVVGVTCDDDCFNFESASEAKALHLIAVEFNPSDKTGAIKETIRIKTDRPFADVTLVAHATVVGGAVVSEPDISGAVDSP